MMAFVSNSLLLGIVDYYLSYYFITITLDSCETWKVSIQPVSRLADATATFTISGLSKNSSPI